MEGTLSVASWIIPRMRAMGKCNGVKEDAPNGAGAIL